MRLRALDAWVRDTAVLTDEPRLKAILHDGARAGGAVVVGEEFHVFPNGAVTGVLVLAQSHLSIHTWPEFALANVDLLSYGDPRGEDVLAGDLRRPRRGAVARGLPPSCRWLSRRSRGRWQPPSGSPRGRGVRAVLDAVARLEPVSVRRLSRAVELPVPIVAAVCGSCENGASSPRSGRCSSRRSDGTFGRGALALGSGRSCPACAGGVVLPQGLGRLRREIRRATEPARRRGSSSTSATARSRRLRRVLALHEADALVGRRVLLLGDDDLTSVAIGVAVRELGSAETVAGLTVVDLDPAVLDYARRAGRRAPSRQRSWSTTSAGRSGPLFVAPSTPS